MRPEDMNRRLDERPFRPFRVHMSDGTLIEVQDPGNVVVGRSSVILPTRIGYDENGRRVAEDWRTIALLHIVQFTDVEPGEAERKAG